VEEGRPELVLSAPRPTVDLDALRAHVASRLGDKARVSTLHDMLVLDVERENLIEVATFVRDDPRTRCDLYSVNAGVDTGAELRSVTFVRGTATKVSVMLRTTCTELDPHIPTLAGVWKGANWCERETYDMFGIEFDGHPDLRRIFLEESFPGHPLRKSFLPPRSDARGG
jgi:NADH-quinone oxidoreductase subunit C